MDRQSEYMVSASLDILAFVTSSFLYQRFPIRWLFFFYFNLTLLFSTMTLGFDITDRRRKETIMYFLSRFSIASCYQLVYLANEIFPILFASTTFGICNLFAAFSMFVSVDVQKLDNNYMLIVIFGVSLLAAGSSLFLKRN